MEYKGFKIGGNPDLVGECNDISDKIDCTLSAKDLWHPKFPIRNILEKDHIAEILRIKK